MDISRWFSQLSTVQRVWLLGTIAFMTVLIGFGIWTDPAGGPDTSMDFSMDMSISEIAPKLQVTGKALARELDLPLEVSKKAPLLTLGVKPETLRHAAHHLLSHQDRRVKYYWYAALVFGGLVFLVRLGRPALSDVKHRAEWYPRAPYILFLVISVMAAGFLLGKSPNPMEGVVKVFKAMVGLYPDFSAKMIAFLFFMALAVIGNKLICGWACPFGALQELIYSIPVLKRIKQRKLPFASTNAIRVMLFGTTLLFLFGFVGGQKGTVLYHGINPFNLFNFDFETIGIGLTIFFSLSGSLIFYRPFCQFICPFGLISWMAEYLSIFRVRVDRVTCTECGVCIKACPSEAAKGRVLGKRFPADCFSCGRCLNVCPVDAIQYRSII